MSDEVKNIVIYVTIAVVLILVATFFATQTMDIGEVSKLDFWNKYQQEPELNTGSGGSAVNYLSSDYSALENMQQIFRKFDPDSRFVNCNRTEYSGGYYVVCDQMIFTLTADEKDTLTYDDVFTVFNDSCVDDWSAGSLSGKDIESEVGVPFFMSIADLSSTKQCWTGKIESDVMLGDVGSKLFIVPRDDSLSPSEDQMDMVIDADSLIVRMAFNVNDDTFEVFAAVCPE